ncbi:MAG: nucleotidyltransferase domain-containing protein [Oscillospiraceae bacterium]|jgi:predicted nucleotidyltransferase|nr:nucleotidyltransferase domain-containing protein [Oscillospiraceae bacterium]
MAANYETVKNAAIRYADDVRRVMPIDKAVLFGSYAKGTADDGSDVDVCFFLPTFGERRRIDIIGDLIGMTRDRIVPFEPIAFTTSEIERGNPFVKEVLSTGVEI